MSSYQFNGKGHPSTGCERERLAARDKMHPTVTDLWDRESWLRGERKGRQNNERPRLLRAWDARAALPQNCSPRRVNSGARYENGPEVLCKHTNVPLDTNHDNLL